MSGYIFHGIFILIIVTRYKNSQGSILWLFRTLSMLTLDGHEAEELSEERDEHDRD